MANAVWIVGLLFVFKTHFIKTAEKKSDDKTTTWLRYHDKIPNGDHPEPPYTKSTWAGSNTSALNCFDKHMIIREYIWDKFICTMDSDGDGRSNGYELADPDCKWTVGSGVPEYRASSHPGVCESENPEKCKDIKCKDIKHRPYWNLIPNGLQPEKPYNKTSWPGLNTPPFTCFDMDVTKHNYDWKKICKLDSDGDRLTNGYELGDPDCIWTPDKGPHKYAAMSNPAVCESSNTTKCTPNSDPCSPKSVSMSHDTKMKYVIIGIVGGLLLLVIIVILMVLCHTKY